MRDHAYMQVSASTTDRASAHTRPLKGGCSGVLWLRVFGSQLGVWYALWYTKMGVVVQICGRLGLLWYTSCGTRGTTWYMTTVERGRMVHQNVRLSVETVGEIQSLAVKHGVSFSTQLRTTLHAGLGECARCGDVPDWKLALARKKKDAPPAPAPAVTSWADDPWAPTEPVEGVYPMLTEDPA